MKVKIVAILTLVILLLASVPVYAETPMPDPPYGAYDYWVVADHNGETALFTSPNPIYVEITDKGNLMLNMYIYKKYVLSGSDWSYDKEAMRTIHAGFNTIYAANHDIAYLDGSGFFFTLPKVSELCQIVRQMKNRGTFGKILKDFSAGLIPLVGLLILAISLTKAWEFLRIQLKH